MGANIDICTQMVRMQKWALIVRDCKCSGQSNAGYCAANGIHIKTFYYWQNKLRRAAADELEQLPIIEETANSQIVPINFPTMKAGGVIIHKAGYTVEIIDGTSSATIEAVLSAVKRQC